MKKVRLIIFLSILYVTLFSATIVLADGNVGEPVIGPKLPQGDYDDDYFNVGKTKLSSPFAFNLSHIGVAPTKMCFPHIFGSSTKVYGNNTVAWQWVKPGMQTKTEIYDGIKFRCANITSPGFYGLIGNNGEKFKHTYPIDKP